MSECARPFLQRPQRFITSSLLHPPAKPQYDATADATLVRWENLFPSATATSDIVLPAGTRVVEEAWLLPGFWVDLFVPSFNLVVEADGALPRWWWWWWGLCVVAVMCRVGCGTCA